MRYVLLACLLLLGSFSSARADTIKEDEATLKNAKIATDTPALLDFFRSRVLQDQDLDRGRQLIKNLNDDSFHIRQKATAELSQMGPGILPLLREASQDRNVEVAVRAKECLRSVEKLSSAPLLCAAARVLGDRKADETAKALIDFAPFADGEDVLEAMRSALLRVAVRGGKPDAALVAALEDKHPARRALAADALIRAKALDEKTTHKFLKDSDPIVRLRSALALAYAADRESIPVLIALLAEAPLSQAWQAEEVLTRLAGENTPQVALGQDERSRANAAAVWEKWWKEHGAKVNLAVLTEKPPFLGLTLVAYQDVQGFGKLAEFGKDGKQRWEISNLSYPVDVQVINENRFLIAELQGGRVTERDRKGTILSSKQIAQPVSCQRLANGNLVIGTTQGVFEFAGDKEVFRYARNRGDIMGVRKHRNGEYIVLTRTTMVRVDAKATEVKHITTGRNYNYSSPELLPNGNVLVPQSQAGQAIEYTLDGNVVGQVKVPFPSSVQRLPNGNLLICGPRLQNVLEVDRDGKTINQTNIQGQPLRAVAR